MTTSIKKLDPAGYRKFGIVTGVIVVVLFGGLLPWLFNFGYPVWPWLLSASLVLLALLAPIALQPVYLVWMRFGLIMNWINTRLILGFLFYGIFLPIGIVFKLIGRDPMQRKLDSRQASYRNAPDAGTSDNMEHPY